MKTVEFTPDMILGDEVVDKQHRELVETVDGLYKKIAAGAGKKEIMDILNVIADHTVYHFKTEEKMFNEHNYPDKEVHKDIHDKFVAHAVDLIKTVDAKWPIAGLDELIEKEITLWLAGHITGPDREAVEWLLQNA